MSESSTAELVQVVADWDRAMTGNDADLIGSFMTDDWMIVGTDGSISGKAEFLGFVRGGDLTHDVMESRDLDVRVHGDAAIVIARGVSGGMFRGEPFLLTERATSVFVRDAGQWRCVSTHLSTMA